jgi:hypothetical protein
VPGSDHASKNNHRAPAIEDRRFDWQQARVVSVTEGRFRIELGIRKKLFSSSELNQEY